MWKRFIVIGWIAFMVQACSAAPITSLQLTPESVAQQATPAVQALATATAIQPGPIAPTASSTFTPFSSVTSTRVPPTPTSTLVACMRTGGRVEVSEFTTILLPNPLVYRIYLPPCYDEQPEQTYPVLYLIHGQTYTDTQWDRLGVPEVADRLIQAGEAVPFIVVMPRDRVWLEPMEDNFGKAVVQALVPWIDEHYRTIPDREHRAIGGLSRGAAWAVHIGLSHWELFGKIGVHSGFVFLSDIQNVYLWLYNTPADKVPLIYMDVGESDRPEIATGSAWLEDFLTSHDVPHEWHMFSGEHEEEYWHAHVEDYLRWYSMDW